MSHSPPTPPDRAQRSSPYSTDEETILETIRVIDRVHIATHTLPRRLPPHLADTSSEDSADNDEDQTLVHDIYAPVRQPVPGQQPNHHLAATMSKSLRAGNQASEHAPNTKHTKNIMANHELDSIQAIWDTLQDTTSGYTDIQRRRDIEDHLRKRAATLQIGATAGWRAVPGSELQQSFRVMGLSEETAQTLASTTHAQQSFRPSSTHRKPATRGRGRGRARGTSS